MRRKLIGLTLAALTLGLSVVPPAAEGGPPASAAHMTNMYQVGDTSIPPIGLFIPPRVFGDGDFVGHGPDVFTSATLRIGIGSPRNLHVFLCMEAEETRPDHTRVGGCEFYLIFQAPAGECVDRLFSWKPHPSAPSMS